MLTSSSQRIHQASSLHSFTSWPSSWNHVKRSEIIYRIVGFFEVIKFHEFCGFDGFVRFKIDPNYICCRAFGLIALDHMSFLGWPFVKIKSWKNENEAFVEFKYLENNQLYGTRLNKIFAVLFWLIRFDL